MIISALTLQQIETWAGEPILTLSHEHDGVFTKTSVVTFRSGKVCFMKCTKSEAIDLRLEVKSLEIISQENVIRTPKVYCFDSSFILMEYIEKGQIGYNFFYNFGKQLASLHKITSDSFGLSFDNFIGSTLQTNIPDKATRSSWVDFFWDKRLYPQYKIAEEKGLVDEHFASSFSKLERIYPKILASVDHETPSLLHGDLWSGNYLSSKEGEVVLIDTAPYYGHREADLALISLFGGFDVEFHDGYEDAFPLEGDWERRQNIYMLYHVLNHMNIFGDAYKLQAIGLMCYYK
ncbi:fructosamine kinase family protein [Halosquirtibacter laminarini]|uniref:Fructosamine kinase family protein n=1 Tax=Halosquirtibacter laminarini TaxID=3374600 RepID=A0AC61NPY8_9BACT|nr:fructosamine kinase family protein [Prolixibacteraceae bacterium]